MNHPSHIHHLINDHDQSPSFRRARTTSFESNNYYSNALPYPRIMMLHPQDNNNPASKKEQIRMGHIFFKTRMSAKLRLCSCRNGENCNFARAKFNHHLIGMVRIATLHVQSSITT
ncbi:unnamed protein product [Lupinus luteus]|uniref:Uncharacterized protein n=1 Tax=Lupinus luteus TaxID=3873 RepID=A0AAV1XM12_LUPLU